ncbi:hypothetical protein O9A_00328 [Bartonella koehlerae C-29]|uniref:Uncharacterized protein n=1 Tax=Bartonella koehlerae C-29 TaxID=1134510 RepID=A0A067WH46_9HYPH|nr:hypothetical protein O9A_00328 [Bartonella koehlerae C-29]
MPSLPKAGCIQRRKKLINHSQSQHNLLLEYVAMIILTVIITESFLAHLTPK